MFSTTRICVEWLDPAVFCTLISNAILHVDPILIGGLTYCWFSATMGAGFSVATVIALALLMEDIPSVRKDIFVNLPIVGQYWDRTVAPEDNPF
jgi:hypothetical protein